MSSQRQASCDMHVSISLAHVSICECLGMMHKRIKTFACLLIGPTVLAPKAGGTCGAYAEIRVLNTCNFALRQSDSEVRSRTSRGRTEVNLFCTNTPFWPKK